MRKETANKSFINN